MKNVFKVITFCILFCTACMPTNKKLFEDLTGISIPSKVKITNDQHQSIGTDATKVLEIQLDAKTKPELLASIKKSRFYNSSASHVIDRKYYRTSNGRHGVWYRDSTGLSFYGSSLDEGDIIMATIDTTRMKARFEYVLY